MKKQPYYAFILETHALMYKKLNSFVYVFVVHCQFFQIDSSGYAL